eukprot:IDg7749t1
MRINLRVRAVGRASSVQASCAVRAPFNECAASHVSAARCARAYRRAPCACLSPRAVRMPAPCACPRRVCTDRRACSRRSPCARRALFMRRSPYSRRALCVRAHASFGYWQLFFIIKQPNAQLFVVDYDSCNRACNATDQAAPYGAAHCNSSSSSRKRARSGMGSGVRPIAMKYEPSS